MITIVKTEAEFDALEERWNDLFRLSSSVTPYQGFMFNKITWDIWHEPEDRLYIICFSQSQGAIIEAIIPCYINKEGELHIIDYLTDFCDGIIPDAVIEKYTMYKEICNHIISDAEIKSVCFNNLCGNNRMLAYLYAFGEYSSVKTLTGYSVIRMTPDENNKDFADSIKSCNSSQRNKLRKRFKGTSSLSLHKYNLPDSFPEEEVRGIADYMVQARIRAKEYFEYRFFKYFRSLYDAGLLTVYSHEKDSLAIAGKIFLVNNLANEYISWITLYRGKQDNSNLLLASLDEMYRNGIYNFNFARGVYAYKLSDFHPQIYTLNQLRIYRSKYEALRANLNEALRSMKNYLKQIAYIKLAGIKQKLIK